MLDRTLIEDYLQPVQTAPVAHYTRIGTLCYFIPEGKSGWASAWAAPVQFLNDRKELTLGLEVLRDVAVHLSVPRKIRSAITYLQTNGGSLETDAFQMSFSGNPDELGQWRGYASNGMGCSVVTDALAVKTAADVAGWVLYGNSEQQDFARKVLSRLQGETDDDLIQRALTAAASYMKHEGFKPEQEFRLLKFPDSKTVRFRESGDRLVPYVDFLSSAPSPLPISRIIIGPGWQLASMRPGDLRLHHVAQGIYRLLTARGLPPVSVESSSIPYDPR